MDERNKEFVAKKKWDKWQVALFTGVILVMVIAFAILSKLGIMFMVAFLFVLGILSLYYMKNIFKAEYAYTISSMLTVEVLKSGGKRTPVCDFYLTDMTLCGRYTEESEAKLTNIDETIVAATDVNDDETYFAIFERDGKSTVLYFTPNEMMLSELKKKVRCTVE